MRRLVVVPPLVLAALFAPARPLAAAPPLTLVACAPGYPGTRAEAQPSMDAFAAAVAGAAGWPERDVAAVYEETEQGGLARLGRSDAAVALVPLPFLAEHGAALKLSPRLQVDEKENGLFQSWSLVAKRGRVGAPAALAGYTILSTAGYAPRFVRSSLANWGRLPDTARIAFTTQVLSALRKAASGADVAVLLDGYQTAALATLPFANDLEVVSRSAPVPVAFVCTVGARISTSRWRILERALEALPGSPAGAAALEGIRMVRFVAPDAAALATARRLAGGAPR